MTFDPNLPFDVVEQEQPRFDPNLDFTIQGGAIPEPPDERETDEERAALELKNRGFFTGEGRRDEDLPSLLSVTEGLTEREKIKIAGAMIATPNEKAIGDVVKSVVPDAEISEDRFGNVIIQFPQGAGGQRVFVNPPGFDRTDFTALAAELVKFFPAGRFAAGAQTVGGAVVKSFGAEAATSIAGDVVAGELGSEQGVEFGRAGLTGIGAALADFLTPRVIRFVRRLVNTKKFFDKTTGNLTALGQREAEKAGIDPDIIDSALGKDFARNLAEGASPDIAAGNALGQKFGIDLTKGQQSRDLGELGREEILRNTQPSSGVFQPRDIAQRKAAAGAAGDIQEQVGGVGITKEVSGGEVVGREITEQRNALLDSLDGAFETARGKNAQFTQSSVSELSKAAAVVSRDFPIDNVLTPGSFRILREIRRLSKNVKSASKRKSTVAFAFFEQTRRRINNTINTIPLSNPSDKLLAVRLKEQYDGFLDDAFDNALFAGDLDVLDTFKKARRLRFELTQRFGKRNANDEAGRVVDKIIQTDATPQQIVNHVFGAARLGGRDVSEKVVNRLKASLGEKSEGFIALKEIGFMRLTRPAGKDFTPELSAKNIKEVFQRSPGMMDALYTKDEQRVIKQFGNLMERLVTPREATNAPRTAFVLRDAIRGALGRAQTMATFRGVPEGGFLIQIFRNLVVPRGGGPVGKARRAFKPFKTPSSPGVIAAGAVAGTEIAEQP